MHAAGSSAAHVGKRSAPTEESDVDMLWSPEVEDAFQEALRLFPPCGKRRSIRSDEGKVYGARPLMIQLMNPAGRNALIANHIAARTGKVRTSKQISSHLQVVRKRGEADDTSAAAPVKMQPPSAAVPHPTPAPKPPTTRCGVLEFGLWMEEAAEKASGRFLEGEIKPETSADSPASMRRFCDSLPGLLELWHKAASNGALIALARCTLDLHSWISTPITSYSFSLRVSTQHPESLKWTTRVYGYGKVLMHHFGISSPQLKDTSPYVVQWPRRVQCDYVFQLLERARTISDVSLSSSMLSNLVWVHTVTERATGECLLLLVHGLDINSGHRSAAGTLLSLVGAT